ncbi:hypothetical protein ACOMHN_029690 [Nucella lapillus]
MKWTQSQSPPRSISSNTSLPVPPGCRRRCGDAGMVYVGRLNGNCICTVTLISIQSANTQHQQQAEQATAALPLDEDEAAKATLTPASQSPFPG